MIKSTPITTNIQSMNTRDTRDLTPENINEMLDMEISGLILEDYHKFLDKGYSTLQTVCEGQNNKVVQLFIL